MDGPDTAVPAESLPYVFCDPCIDKDCANCIGLTHTRPFCGHRCGWTETIDAPEENSDSNERRRRPRR